MLLVWEHIGLMWQSGPSGFHCAHCKRTSIEKYEAAYRRRHMEDRFPEQFLARADVS